MKKQYSFEKARRGAVLPNPPGKSRITIRIDDDVLEWFRKRAHEAGGGNYQTMINHALRQFTEAEAESLEDTLRRVLREVLPESKSGTREKRVKRRSAPSRKKD